MLYPGVDSRSCGIEIGRHDNRGDSAGLSETDQMGEIEPSIRREPRLRLLKLILSGISHREDITEHQPVLWMTP